MRPKASYATAACREMVYGTGTSDCIQRVIDLARVAVGADQPTPALDAIVWNNARAAKMRRRRKPADNFGGNTPEVRANHQAVADMLEDVNQATLRG